MQHVLKNSIYCYVEPRRGHPLFGEVRYVGKDEKFGRRGMNFAGHAKGHVFGWLYDLAVVSEVPIVRIIFEFDECTNDRRLLLDAERYWIDYGRQHGWPLLNFTEEELRAIRIRRSSAGGRRNVELGTGWFGMSPEAKFAASSKAGRRAVASGQLAKLTFEQRSRGGKTAAVIMNAKMTFEQRARGGKNADHKKGWETRRAKRHES